MYLNTITANKVQTCSSQASIQVFQLVYIHTIGTVDTWGHIGQGFTTSINTIDGDTRTVNDGQAILVDGGRTHYNTASVAQVKVFVQFKVYGIAIASDFDVVLTCSCTNVYGITWLNLSSDIAIGLDVPTFRSQFIYCVKLAAIHRILRGAGNRTRCNIGQGVATEVHFVAFNHDGFAATSDIDAAFVDGHQVFGCIAQSHTIKYRTLSKLNLHVAVLVGHCLDVLSTVSTHSGCISGVVSDGNRIDSGTNDAQSLAQITVADIAFIVWEVQTSSSQAVTQIVQLAYINGIS